MPYKSKKGKKKVNYKKLKAITKARKKAKKKIKKEVCDDSEFTTCQHCKSDVCAYNNTTRSALSPLRSETCKALLDLQSSNCEKCGKFVEFHPERSADASIIFLCSNAKPCSHCLCYDCGILYNLKTDIVSEKEIVKALQDTTTSETTPRGESAKVRAESPEPTSDDSETSESDGDDEIRKSYASTVVPMAIMAEMMHGMDMEMDTASLAKEVAVREQGREGSVQTDTKSSDGLILGTMCALLVSNYVLGTCKTRKLKNVGCFFVFALIAYLGMYIIPFSLFLTLLVGALSVVLIARCNFVSTLYAADITELNVTIDLDLDENIEYDVITKG